MPQRKPARTFAAIERRGLRAHPAGDAYHYLLVTSWPAFFGMIALAYTTLNALFAVGYALSPGCLENATSFADGFFFSVQTMATIGYGRLSPVTTYANVLVTCESLLGIFGVALVTGLTFAKFARPTARVLFSNHAVVTERDGQRSLMFRMANERQTSIVDVNIHVVLARVEVTVEGETLRRFHTLELTRSRVATFALTWTSVHPITPGSPLFGLDAAGLRAAQADVVVSITGLDETFSQTIHARTSYAAEEIVFDHRFADLATMRPDGVRVIDYTRFHDVLPVSSRAAAPAAPAAPELAPGLQP